MLFPEKTHALSTFEHQFNYEDVGILLFKVTPGYLCKSWCEFF